MRVVVISGSPKGKNSITVQSAEYLKKHYTNDEFEIIHVGNKVKKYSNSKAVDECVYKMINSDLIIFAYPVYTFLAPYQLARFINYLKQSKNVKKLDGKFVTQITTSKHFFDTTAHRYIKDNCDDLGMKSITGLAADMDDLLTNQGRTQLNDFYKSSKFAIENDLYNRIGRAKLSQFDYVFNGIAKQVQNEDGYDTVIVTDCKDDNKSLRNMIDAFVSAYKYPVREVNISKFKFSGGCLGCFDCATDGSCIYQDGFEDMLRNEVQNADATILAGTIIDHSMGSVFKCYDDRQFCNGHRVLTKGKAVGYILDGYLSKEHNLLDVIESRSEVGHMYLSGIATNESENDKETTKSIEDFAKATEFFLENKLERPQNFFGVGGMKIFRDLIYVMRGLMKEDHAFYKKHDIYNFPHKQKWLIIKMKLVGMLMSVPSIKKKSRGMMNDIMLKPYKKAINKEK
jgi:multimeric flavodoxin WrbA